MDPRDHLRALPDGLACTVCDESVPVDRIRLLARRDDLSFIQIDCARCGSTTLEFVADSAPLPRSAAGAPPAGAPPAGAPPITRTDVVAMHDLLVDWQGDLRGLVGAARLSTGPRPSWRGDGGRRS